MRISNKALDGRRLNRGATFLTCAFVYLPDYRHFAGDQVVSSLLFCWLNSEITCQVRSVITPLKSDFLAEK